MLHHISFAIADLRVAGVFYDSALGALGYRRVFEDDTAIGYGIEASFGRVTAVSVHRPGPSVEATKGSKLCLAPQLER
jgi:catechol 2,3-dioxygenase-like lactoylglutathione lyase family enzyme